MEGQHVCIDALELLNDARKLIAALYVPLHAALHGAKVWRDEGVAGGPSLAGKKAIAVCVEARSVPVKA